MLIMCRNDEEIIYQCPKCRTISRSSANEEIDTENENKEELKEN